MSTNTRYKFSHLFLRNISFLLLTGFLTAQSGCKVTAPPPLPEVKQLPAQYGATATGVSGDSVRLVFRNLFNDPYLISFLDSALKNNSDLQIAWQRIAKAEARLVARKAAMLPAVSGVVSAGAERYGDYTMNGVGNFDTNLSPNISSDQKIPVSPTTDMFVGLRSDWEIDIWGKLRNLRKSALAEALATKEARQMIITELIASLTEKYYHLLSIDSELKIVRNNVLLQEDALRIVQAQKEGGRATELAVQQFAAQLLNTRAIEYNLKQEQTAVENEMNALAGYYPATIPRDTLIPDINTVTSVSIGVPADLLLNRPDIRQQEWLMTAAKENVLAARKSFLPSLIISPYIGLNAFSAGLLFKQGSGVYGLLGGLTAPLFQRRNLKAQYAIVNANNQETVYRYQQTLLNAYAEVMTGVKAIANQRSFYLLKAQEVHQLQQAVITSRDLYLAGYASYLEVVTAQKNVLEAELEMMRGKRNIFIAVAKLYRSLGGGWQ